jgi:hypothetical protein
VNAVLVIAAVVAVAIALRGLVEALPLVRRVPPAPPAPARAGLGDLERLDRAVSTATTYAGDVHVTLRPMLREIAADGLRRRGVELDDRPEAARALLAPQTWELVRPDRPRPGDAFARGLTGAELDAVLSDLEALLR